MYLWQNEYKEAMIMRLNRQYSTGNSKRIYTEKKVLPKLVSSCAWCGMPLNNDDSSRAAGKAEELFNDIVLTHGICLECLWKLSPEIYTGLFEFCSAGHSEEFF
jgi:hypothetical protein